MSEDNKLYRKPVNHVTQVLPLN